MGIKLTKTIKARATSDGLARASIDKTYKLNIKKAYQNILSIMPLGYWLQPKALAHLIDTSVK